MKRASFVVLLALAAVGGGVMAPAVSADHNDRYYGQRYYRGRNRDDIRRREILRDRLIDLGDRVRLAERERSLSRGEARDLYEDLDDVRDFLRHDSNLTDSEFDRRRDDLNDVQRRLRVYCDGRGHHDRRDDRYGGRDPRDWNGDDWRGRDRDDRRRDDRYRRR